MFSLICFQGIIGFFLYRTSSVNRTTEAQTAIGNVIGNVTAAKNPTHPQIIASHVVPIRQSEYGCVRDLV